MSRGSMSDTSPTCSGSGRCEPKTPTHTALTIAAPRATITAESVYGALNGLESFSQLVERGSLVNGTTIKDEPRYKFRAVMIDTARHFYHKEVILQHLDAMA